MTSDYDSSREELFRYVHVLVAYKALYVFWSLTLEMLIQSTLEMSVMVMFGSFVYSYSSFL